jgi:peptidoglycan/xylan/chitin deacetylase (PgdA/CDA1 family)
VTDSLGRARWIAKKASRQAVVLASRMGAARQSADAPTVRALTYHRVRAADREPFSVTPEAFEAQMAWLASEGLAVSLAEVEQVLAGTGSLRRNAVLVTIDDGYRDVYTDALAILSRHRIPALLFVSTAAIEERDSAPVRGVGADAHVSWSELAELVQAGIAIGSHGWEHRSLAQMLLNEAEGQMVRSRTVLEQRLGIAVRAFAYPFGTRADYSSETRAALVRSGYTTGFTSQHGAIAAGMDSFTLPRIKIEGGEGMWMFRQLVAGGLDNWSLVDRYLWRVQASGVGPA